MKERFERLKEKHLGHFVKFSASSTLKNKGNDNILVVMGIKTLQLYHTFFN